MTITTILFDVGGVLSHPPFEPLEAYAAEVGLPAGVLGSYFRGDAEFARFERGETDARTFFGLLLDRVEDAHGVRLDLRRVTSSLEKARDIRPEMLQFARSLSASYQLGALTNNIAENSAWLEENLPGDVFAAIVNSAVVGLRKPDPRVYQHALDQLSVDAPSVLYVDDFEENLAPAAELGMETLHFVSTDQCREELILRGLIPADMEHAASHG